MTKIGKFFTLSHTNKPVYFLELTGFDYVTFTYTCIEYEFVRSTPDNHGIYKEHIRGTIMAEELIKDGYREIEDPRRI